MYLVTPRQIHSIFLQSTNTQGTSCRKSFFVQSKSEIHITNERKILIRYLAIRRSYFLQIILSQLYFCARTLMLGSITPPRRRRTR